TATRTVNNTGRSDHIAARLLDRFDAFARRQAGRDDIFDHDDLLARLDREATTQLELAVHALDIHGAHLQVLGGFVTRDNAADSGRNRRVNRTNRSHDLLGQRLAQTLATLAIHEDKVLLEEDGAVQTRG